MEGPIWKHASRDCSIKIVDQVFYEITKTRNDPKGEVGVALKKPHNQIDIVETNVGVAYQKRRERNPERLANIQHRRRERPVPPLCRSCCMKTLTLWNCALPVLRTFTSSTRRLGF
jgi:hypothetical protein